MGDWDDADPILDLEERRRKEWLPVEGGGEGQAEGFELSEEDLIDRASDGDQVTPSPVIALNPLEAPVMRTVLGIR